jgi:hypothetical protein
MTSKTSTASTDEVWSSVVFSLEPIRFYLTVETGRLTELAIFSQNLFVATKGGGISRAS